MTAAAQLAQSVAPGVSLGFKNRIINGGMAIDQRNAGASVTPNNTYTIDRWFALNSQTSKFAVQQNANAVSGPTGFTKMLGVVSSSAYSVLTGDYFALGQRIEGFNISDLAWGTVNAKTVTLSFQVQSSLTGTFGGSLRNGAANRSYPFTYSIPVANTWTSISITIAGDTTGTWSTDNSIGIEVDFGLGAGATYSGTAGSWAAGNYVTATGATSVVGTSGATFYITGVQLEVGTAATSFEFRDYGRELIMCQRYYETLNTIGNVMTWTPGACSDSNNLYWPWVYRVAKRATPTVAFNDSTAANYQAYSSGGYKTVTSVGVDNTTITNAALLTTTSGGFTQGYAAITRYAGSGICAYANAEL